MKVGFWPGTPDNARFETIFDERVFQRFALLREKALNLGTKTWLRAFAEEARDFGVRVNPWPCQLLSNEPS